MNLFFSSQFLLLLITSQKTISQNRLDISLVKTLEWNKTSYIRTRRDLDMSCFYYKSNILTYIYIYIIVLEPDLSLN